MKLTFNIIVATAIALTLPAAAFAQSTGSGASDSAGAANPSATDIRPSGQGATAITTGSSASAMDHPNGTDSTTQQTTGNGIPVTSGSTINPPTAPSTSK